MKALYNKPCTWCDPKGFSDRLVLNYRWRERKTDNLIFMQGRPLPFDTGLSHWQAPAQDPAEYDLVLHAETMPAKWLKYDCLPNTLIGNPPIVNRRVLHLLEDLCPVDFQAFPVVIKNENPKLPDFENHAYHLINITHCVDAIDRERSVITYQKNGNIDDLTRLRLIENGLAQHHLAPIDNYHSIILASPQLVALFKKEKVKGVRFLTDEEDYP